MVVLGVVVRNGGTAPGGSNYPILTIGTSSWKFELTAEFLNDKVDLYCRSQTRNGSSWSTWKLIYEG